MNFIDPTGMDSTNSQETLENDDIVEIDGVKIAFGLVDNLYANGFFSASSDKTTVNISDSDDENSGEENDNKSAWTKGKTYISHDKVKEL